MGVTFALRAVDLGPTGTFVAHFDNETVLDWFVHHWIALAADEHESAEAHVEYVMGTYVYGLSSLGVAIQRENLAPPRSMEELRRILTEHLYVEGEVRVEEHCIQALTDDDNSELAYFFVDDAFLAAHGDLAVYLLREDWRLPTAVAPVVERFAPQVESGRLGQAGGVGTTWLCFVGGYDKMNLSSVGPPLRLDNARLSDLPAWLASQRPEPGWSFGFELRLLRAHLLAFRPHATGPARRLLNELRANPDDAAAWSVYADWRASRGDVPAHVEILDAALRECGTFDLLRLGNGDWSPRLIGSVRDAHRDGRAWLASQPTIRERPLVATSAHLAQACLPRGHGNYFQWICFDDVWARTHPTLAEALLRWTAEWDVLTVPRCGSDQLLEPLARPQHGVRRQ
ncbi:MAG: hypothetical protein AAF211_09975 [Myxococcota bacterium]